MIRNRAERFLGGSRLQPKYPVLSIASTVRGLEEYCLYKIFTLILANFIFATFQPELDKVKDLIEIRLKGVLLFNAICGK